MSRRYRDLQRYCVTNLRQNHVTRHDLVTSRDQVRQPLCSNGTQTRVSPAAVLKCCPLGHTVRERRSPSHTR